MAEMFLSVTYIGKHSFHDCKLIVTMHLWFIRKFDLAHCSICQTFDSIISTMFYWNIHSFEGTTTLLMRESIVIMLCYTTLLYSLHNGDYSDMNTSLHTSSKTCDLWREWLLSILILILVCIIFWNMTACLCELITVIVSLIICIPSITVFNGIMHCVRNCLRHVSENALCSLLFVAHWVWKTECCIFYT